MKRLIFLTFILMLTLACTVVIDLGGKEAPINLPRTVTIPGATDQSPSHEGTTTQSEASPLPPSPPATFSPDLIEEVQKDLQKFIASPRWLEVPLPDAARQRWQAIAQGEIAPSAKESAHILALLTRLETIEHLLEESAYPIGGQPELRFRMPIEENQLPVPYLVQANGSLEHNAEQLYLWVRNDEGGIVSMLPAPWVEGLLQRISEDGEFVEYYPQDKDWIVKGEARQLDPKKERHKYTLEMLAENNPPSNYAKTNIFPRYYFNFAHIHSAFYGIGELTLNQILLLQSVLELFNRPTMQELAEYIFTSGEQVEYIVSRVAHPYAAAMARPLGGDPPQGIIVLYTKNLFDNKYETAASIAHEAAHIWQGPPASCENPQARLNAEIGNGIVSSAFYSWRAKDLYQAVRSGEAGAYHATLWVLLQFNQMAQAEWVKSVIRTGTANGQSIINCP